jgi:hypothetical protein
MVTARFLMIASETLLGVALIAQFVLRTNIGVTFHLGDRTIALPIRWFVPLLLISVAAAFSTVALANMVWTLTHAIEKRLMKSGVRPAEIEELFQSEAQNGEGVISVPIGLERLYEDGLWNPD